MDEPVETNIVQDDAAIDADKGDKFYKSQEEVDRAFRKRLERERRKWEESLKKNNTDNLENIEKSEQEIKDENIVSDELKNIGDDLLPLLSKLDKEIGNEDNPETIDSEETEEFVNGMLNEISDLEQEYDGIDLTQDLKNPLFLHMLENGEPLKKVYDYFNPEKSREVNFRELEREVTERIRLRNSRPVSISHANSQNTVYDVSRLSQSEIEDIDRRVKRGERVVL